MKAIDVTKVFGTALISQVVAFLNAVYQPFENTIFVFNGWQAIASRSAVAVGFVVVLVIAALVVRSGRPVTARALRLAAGSSVALLAVCAGIYVLLSSGFAPSVTFLFWIRDIVWMLVYGLMLVAVGLTVALACLSFFGVQKSEAN